MHLHSAAKDYYISCEGYSRSEESIETCCHHPCLTHLGLSGGFRFVWLSGDTLREYWRHRPDQQSLYVSKMRDLCGSCQHYLYLTRHLFRLAGLHHFIHQEGAHISSVGRYPMCGVLTTCRHNLRTDLPLQLSTCSAHFSLFRSCLGTAE